MSLDHAGVSSILTNNGPRLSDTAFAAVTKEYEDGEEDGKDLD